MAARRKANRNKGYERKRRTETRDYVRAQKEASPCSDCGEFYPYYVMDFDHVRSKYRNISRMASQGWSLEKVKEEIAKCELVCSNCHRIRTHKRATPLE